MALLTNIKRFKEIAWFLIKYGQTDLIKKIGLDIPLNLQEPQKEVSAFDLSSDLQSLGPTYIKLGQLLSTQFNLLPEIYQKALINLQDDAETFPFSDVRKIIHEELGVKIEDIFQEFDIVPLAAASLSQVHRAQLPSGKVVVVKVQRPGIRSKIVEDLQFLDELGEFIDTHHLLGKNYYFKDRVKAFKNILINELDFKKEALNLTHFKHNLSGIEGIVVPSPIDDYTTSKVLTMEYISSKKITTLHPLLLLELEGEQLAKNLFDAYLKQLFIDGLVHIDPHPGNVYLTDSNEIALLDLGMVDYLSHQMQQDLLDVLLSVMEGKGEEVYQLLLKMGQPEDHFNDYQFKEGIVELVARHQNLNWKDMAVGSLFLKVAAQCTESGLRLTPKFNVFGKVLMNLDGIIRVLSPSFDSNAYIRQNIALLFRNRIENTFTQETLFKMTMNITELLTKFGSPKQVVI